MKKVKGHIEISVIVECPYCLSDIDLFHEDELTEEGYLQKILFNGDWGVDDLNAKIECPDCSENFLIGEIIW